jgi:hypothetical protein
MKRLSLIVGFVACLGFCGTASATLLHDFVDGNGDIVGHIEFSASTPGTVLDFELAGPGVLLTEANLCPAAIAVGAQACEIRPSAFETSWSIDDAGVLNDFFLHLDFEDLFGGDQVEGKFAFQSPASLGYSTAQTEQISGSSCSGRCQTARNNWLDFVTNGLHTVAVFRSVPEPGSSVLMAMALSLLAMSVRTRRGRIALR